MCRHARHGTLPSRCRHARHGTLQTGMLSGTAHCRLLCHPARHIAEWVSSPSTRYIAEWVIPFLTLSNLPWCTITYTFIAYKLTVFRQFSKTAAVFKFGQTMYANIYMGGGSLQARWPTDLHCE